MKITTSGERLFLLLRDELLDSTGHGEIKWSNLGDLFYQIGGRQEFGNYLRGAAAIHVMRRLLRYWKDEKKNISQESQYVKKMTTFIREEMLYGLGTEDASRLARAAIAAEKSSFQEIGRTVRARIIAGKTQIQCYLCTTMLDPKAPEGSTEHLTLEHIWPQSIGGDSVEENLLPACTECQKTTKDTISWEWFNIHNVVLPSEPSKGALASVSRKGYFARHFYEAMKMADEEHCSLKDAFCRLGPIKDPITSIRTGYPATFFDLQTAQ